LTLISIVEIVLRPIGKAFNMLKLADYSEEENSRTKGTSLGCRLAREMIPIVHNVCRLSCSSITITLPRLFWDLETPAQKLENFSPLYACGSDSRMFYQKWSKSVQDKWPKGRVALITKTNKTRFGTLGRKPWDAFPHFSCVSAHHGSSLIFQISSR